jgi:FdhD protein
MIPSIQASVQSSVVRKYKNGLLSEAPDFLAIEEPLEIRLEYGPLDQRMVKSLSITMRTPGADIDLVTGFLRTEGIIKTSNDLLDIRVQDFSGNVVQACLNPALQFDMQQLERHFYTSSSCGVCGKTSIDAVKTAVACSNYEKFDPISASMLGELPALLRAAQDTFEVTGGLHAAALFDRNGQLLAIREDVGRHNALDKLIGWATQLDQLPLNNHILLLSGRASFELVQKSAMAGLRVICAVGAPSNLAVATAHDFSMALIGFLRDGRFNLYSYPEYVQLD